MPHPRSTSSANPKDENEVGDQRPPSTSTALIDWLKSQFGLFYKAADYWSDRKRILSKSLLTIDDLSHLQTRSFSYAITSMFLPSMFLAAALIGITSFVNFPKTQIDLMIDRQQAIKKLLDDATEHEKLFRAPKQEDRSLTTLTDDELETLTKDLIGKITNLKKAKNDDEVNKLELERLQRQALGAIEERVSRTMGSLHEPLLKAKIEATQNEIGLLKVKSLTAKLAKFDTAIVGVWLICNAYLFTWFVRRLRPEPPNMEIITDAHLYILGTVLLFLGAAITLLGLFLDMSLRYDVSWYYESVGPYLNYAAKLWFFLALILGGRRLSIILDGEASFFGRVTWRLLASQLIVGLSVQLALFGATVALYRLT